MIVDPIDCGGLQDIPNGEVDYTSSAVGSTATYTCNTGFELVGQRSRSCQSSGSWGGTVPSCRRKLTFTMWSFPKLMIWYTCMQLLIVAAHHHLQMDELASLQPPLEAQPHIHATLDLN